MTPAMGARAASLREYAADSALLDFAEGQGFEIEEPYDYAGEQLVTLTKRL